jgi:hypothetical protein
VQAAMQRSLCQVYRWHKAFLEGREEVGDEARTGRPSTSTTDENVTRVRELLNSDSRLSVRLMAQTLNIPKRWNASTFPKRSDF